ncbi:hypothetical protein ULF88_09195 [Halopseudomonas pachastrellae]|nr:hypothetical protein [Halopseudomonas pachastrellae]
MTANARAWVVTLSYVLVATLWVLFSDGLLLMLALEDQQRLQSLKGVGFVLVTGALLFFLCATTCVAAGSRKTPCDLGVSALIWR